MAHGRICSRGGRLFAFRTRRTDTLRLRCCHVLGCSSILVARTNFQTITTKSHRRMEKRAKLRNSLTFSIFPQTGRNNGRAPCRRSAIVVSQRLSRERSALPPISLAPERFFPCTGMASSAQPRAQMGPHNGRAPCPCAADAPKVPPALGVASNAQPRAHMV